MAPASKLLGGVRSIGGEGVAWTIATKRIVSQHRSQRMQKMFWVVYRGM